MHQAERRLEKVCRVSTQARKAGLWPVKLVLIEWRDSYGCSPDWQPIDGVSPKPLVCRSVGWLAYDGEECKLVVPHVSGDHESAKKQGCGDMTIPTSAIISVSELRLVAAKKRIAA